MRFWKNAAKVNPEKRTSEGTREHYASDGQGVQVFVRPVNESTGQPDSLGDVKTEELLG